MNIREQIDNAHLDLDNAQIGDGCTYTLWSDSHACTIVKRTAKTIWAQRDIATLDNASELKWSPGGFAGHCEGAQRYSYQPDPDGHISKFTRRTITNPYSGKTRVVWKLAGTGSKSPGNTLHAGRTEHYDFNF